MKTAGNRVLLALREALQMSPENGRVFAAVSGGLDSMVMLEGLARLKQEGAFGTRPLLVLHVNHALRGEESNADQAFVRKRASELGCEVMSICLDWTDERPSQAACREKRERFFREALVGQHDRIWLAHHLDDQAETLFFRLMRGSGLDGLQGMRILGRRKIRPFLNVTKRMMQDAAREWNVEWRDDSSNQSKKYARNWIRLELFPMLEERWPGFSHRLANLAEESRETLSQLPKKELPLFEWQGFTLAKPGEWGSFDARDLKRAFALGRTHSEELFSLLKKTSGELTASRARFRFSSGILLVERESRFDSSLRVEEEGGLAKAHGPLGCWRVELKYGEQLLPAGIGAKGERLKKEFQKKNVPTFFRASMPVLVREKDWELLLPSANRAAVQFVGSPLAAWWQSKN